MKLRAAFTLIELLVVIAIIAILAAILFPVFAQAKEAAKKTAALSNLKQNAVAVLMYNTDSDGYFGQSAYSTNTPNGLLVPGSVVFSLFDALQPYGKNPDTLLAPGDPDAIKWDEILAEMGMTPANVLRSGFAFNFALFEDPAVGPNLFGDDPVMNEASLDEVTATPMFFDSRYTASGATNPNVPSTLDVAYPYRAAYRVPDDQMDRTNFSGVPRYADGVCVNFSDSHSKWYKVNAKLAGAGPDSANLRNTIQCFELPYDLNGVPGISGEPRP